MNDLNKYFLIGFLITFTFGYFLLPAYVEAKFLSLSLLVVLFAIITAPVGGFAGKIFGQILEEKQDC